MPVDEQFFFFFVFVDPEDSFLCPRRLTPETIHRRPSVLHNLQIGTVLVLLLSELSFVSKGVAVCTARCETQFHRNTKYSVYLRHRPNVAVESVTFLRVWEVLSLKLRLENCHPNTTFMGFCVPLDK
jgi:hypothetical protein